MSAQKTQKVSTFEKINLKPVETVFDEQLGKIDKDNKVDIKQMILTE
jgi:hypothetical protein